MSESKRGLPYISRDDIEQALKELGYSTVDYPENPLHYLLIVELELSAPPMPKGDRSRAYILRQILINCIETKLCELRSEFDLPMPLVISNTHNSDWKQTDFYQAVVNDSKQDSKELLAWSLLYHCYVRVELGLTPPIFSSWVGTGTRNINRFRQYAVKCLADKLIEAEHHARLKERKKRLYSVLPFSHGSKIFGRDEGLDAICNRITADGIRHIYISGSAGVGKTTLAQILAERLIENEQIDEVVWVDAPQSITYIRQYVAEQIVPEGVLLSPRNLMMNDHQRTLIVCDGVDGLLESEKAALEALLRDWDSAIMIVTSRAYETIGPIGAYFHLDGLSQDAAREYLLHLFVKMGRLDDLGDDELIEGVIDDIGTNPRALQDVVARLEMESWEQVRQIVHHDLFSETFEVINKAVQIAWCIYALYPACGVSLEQIRSFWTPSIDGGVITELRRHFVIEMQSDRDVYRLKDDALQFIRAAFKFRKDVRSVIESLIQHIDKQVLYKPDITLVVAQQVLISDWLNISFDQRLSWIRSLWQEGLKQGYASLWRIILEPLLAYSGVGAFDMRLAYSLCLRRLGEWEAADAMLEQIVGNCGNSKRPDFASQARALFEQSIVARYGGKYERAHNLLHRAEATASHFQESHLIESIHIEKAHIALERQHYGDANLILGNLPMSAQVALLMSEAALGQGEIIVCRDYVERGFHLASHDLGIQAALFNVLGRSYELEHNYMAASRCFKSSIVRLERGNDVDGVARMRGNLGVALMRSGEYRDAREVFEQAEGDLRELGDVIGVAAVRHNRRILYNLIASS
jgi:tetratricopeptide (TPR) repeat protein